MTERQVKLFRNGRNQVVRIPREFELPGRAAVMRKEGERLIIEPAAPRALLALARQLGRSRRGRALPRNRRPAAGACRSVARFNGRFASLRSGRVSEGQGRPSGSPSLFFGKTGNFVAHFTLQAMGGLPYFQNKSLIASLSKVSPFLPSSRASIRNCLCVSGSSTAVSFFLPARVAA